MILTSLPQSISLSLLQNQFRYNPSHGNISSVNLAGAARTLIAANLGIAPLVSGAQATATIVVGGLLAWLDYR
jgi:hypothetical protein